MFWVFVGKNRICNFVLSLTTKNNAVKNYDYDKAKELIEKHSLHLQKASLGMHEDWSWTAETVWEDGEYKKNLDETPEIGGIKGSRWATPSIELIFKDGSEKMIPCFEGENSGMPDLMAKAMRPKPSQTPLSNE